MAQTEETIDSRSGMSASLRILLVVACVAITIPVMHQYAALVNGFVLALIIVMTMSPIMGWLRAHRVPSGLAYAMTLLLTLVLMAVFTVATITGFAEMLIILNQYGSPMENALASLRNQGDALGINPEPILQTVDPQRVLQQLGSFLDMIMSSISFVGMIGIIIIFMLGEALNFPQKLEAQLDLNSPFFPQFYEFSHSIRRYVSITAVIGAISGLIIWIVLSLLGIQSAHIWGLLYFVTSFIPTVGFWLALIPPLIVSGLQFGWGMVLVVLLFYLIFSAIVNQGIRPIFMGEGLDLSPLWVILSLFFWGAILGLPGVIVGVPLTVMVKNLLLETSPDTRWLAGLMGAGNKPKDVLELD